MSRPAPASTRTARLAPSLVLFGVVVLLITGVETFLWWAATQRPSGLDREIFDSVDLGSASSLSSRELLLLAALLALRLVLLLWPRGRGLEPLVDLPLLGFVLAVTGGGLSVLDPALPLAYVAALIFLGREPRSRRERWLLILRVLVGYGIIHGITTSHDRQRLVTAGAEQRGAVENAILALREQLQRPVADARTGITLVRPDLEGLARPVRGAQEALEAYLDRLSSGLSAPRFQELTAALEVEMDVQREAWFAALDPEQEGDVEVLSLKFVQDTQREVLSRIKDESTRLRYEIERADRIGDLLEGLQVRSGQRRIAIALPLALFAWMIMVLRAHLRDAVQAVEKERSQKEIELREHEKNNWIALTAGLTHGLGNDILAYDVYLSQVLRELQADPACLSPRSRELLGFVHDSNKGRLAFLQFLEAFARERKGGAPELPAAHVELVPLLHAVREHLARVETANLPQESRDPAVVRQRRRFCELPLEIEVQDPDAAVVHRGHRGILEFFAYELLKNALRSASGERPVKVELSRREGFLHLRMQNDVAVERAAGLCGRCGAASNELTSVLRRRDEPAACPRCFAEHLAEMLAGSFEPGKGGGTGLGLFLIRYFVTTYHGGSVTAHVVDASVPLVAFELAIPDGNTTIPRS